MRQTAASLFAICCILLSGCSANLTNLKPYKYYVNTHTILYEDVLVCPLRDDLQPYMMFIKRRAAGQRLMILPGNPMKDYYQKDYCARPFAVLKGGSGIKLDQVTSFYDGGRYTIHAYGQYSAADGFKAPFLYNWETVDEGQESFSGLPKVYLLRAPWENPVTPEKRLVGRKGTDFKE